MLSTETFADAAIKTRKSVFRMVRQMLTEDLLKYFWDNGQDSL